MTQIALPRSVPVRRRRRNRSVSVLAALRYGAVVVTALLMFFPLYHLITLSLMPPADALSGGIHLVPTELHWANYTDAYAFLSGRTVLNSFIFTLGVLVLQLMLALPAGFALAHFRFPGAKYLLALFILPMFLPANVFVIPLYVVTLKLGLVDTYAGLILPIVGSTAFGTLLFRQFFVQFPASLVEAARLDGAGWWQVLFRIAIPLAKPAMAAYSAITFVNAWNMYVWPQIVATNPDLRVIPVALAPLARSAYSILPPTVGFAAAVISALPVALFFLLAQRWFLNAIQGTGVD